ncbi:hypothetical protein BDN70DRAFT_886658 [Pholiota conissans]|uniref:Uncharacterized protein n=1 Tax=Pholiota conissans TaxID=109636 RepID=A0A9P5YS78_9AGAR|nr:hypothetical protein BDN70DRAFT_886658 [Pholiota conissans]
MSKPVPRVSSIIAWRNQSKETLRMLSENTIEIGTRAEFSKGYLNRGITDDEWRFLIETVVSGGRFSTRSKRWISSSIVEVPPYDPSTTAMF